MTDEPHSNIQWDVSCRRARDRDIQKLSGAAKCILGEIFCASLDRRHGKVKRLTAAYLNSRVARLWAAQRALDYRASDRSIQRLAQRINPFQRVSAGVNWRPEPKKSGRGTRIICSLPPSLKASHYLIKDVLEAQFQPPEHLYDVKGRGRDQAARALKRAMEAGYDKCFIGDVRDCYQHVAASTLATHLPLPRLVIEHSLNYQNLVLRRRNATGVSGGLYASLGNGWNGPQGLLQGSPASSVILAILFASMAAQIDPHECLLFVFSDNLLIAAKSEAVLDTTISLIREFLHEHPAGPFDLKNDSRKVAHGNTFEFLGYSFEFQVEGVLIEPSHSGWERLLGRLLAFTQTDIARGDGLATASEEAIRNGLSGYSAWTEREQWREIMVEEARLTVDHCAQGLDYVP